MSRAPKSWSGPAVRGAPLGLRRRPTNEMKRDAQAAGHNQYVIERVEIVSLKISGPILRHHVLILHLRQKEPEMPDTRFASK